MSATTSAHAGDMVPPCLCVLLELALKHGLVHPEDVLELGMNHPRQYAAIVHEIERAIDEIEPCDENFLAHLALTEQVAKCHNVIR